MHTKNKFFDVTSLYKPKEDKPKSGDFTQFEIFEEESLVVCALADGVSTRRDDWWASKTACQSSIEYIGSNKEEIKKRIEDAVYYAHSQVKDPNHPDTGPECSMALVIWDYKTNLFHFANVGDTRIYLIKSNEIIKLTEDDTAPQRFSIAGKPITDTGGSPVFFDGMTKTIGHKTDFDLTIFEQNFGEGDSIVLTSDGVHKKGGMISEILNVIASDNIEKSLNVFIDECINYIEDDASVIILRRNDFKPQDVDLFENIMKKKINFEDSELSPRIFSKFLIEKTTMAIIKRDINNLEKYLEMISNYSFDVQRDNMIHLFGKYCELKINNSNVYSLFSTIIKKASLNSNGN